MRYQVEESIKEKTIKVHHEVLEALEAVNYFSKKKVRALFKLSKKTPPVTFTTRKRQYGASLSGLSPF